MATTDQADIRAAKRAVYAEGRQARRDGLPQHANPYAGTGLGPHWADGYTDEAEQL